MIYVVYIYIYTIARSKSKYAVAGLLCVLKLMLITLYVQFLISIYVHFCICVPIYSVYTQHMDFTYLVEIRTITYETKLSGT